MKLKMKDVLVRLAVLMLMCTAIAPVVTAVLGNHTYDMPIQVLDIAAAIVAVVAVVTLVIVHYLYKKEKEKALIEEAERRIDEMWAAHKRTRMDD